MKKIIIFFLVSFVLGVCYAIKEPDKGTKISNSVEEAMDWLKENTSSTTTTPTVLTTQAPTATTNTSITVTQEVVLNTNTQYHYRGFLVDDNGKVLVYNENDKRMITDEYAECLGNVLDGYNSQLGLDKEFEEKLRSPCPSDHGNSYRTENGYPIGQSLELTLDADLQKSIYDYMKNHNIIGSTTILLGEGAVKVLVSYPSYNANNDLADQTLQPHACYNRCVEAAIPGSTFKILSSVVAADYGITEYYDPGYIHEFDVSNWDVKDKKTYTTPIKRSLREAFRLSSNCWFSQLFYENGSNKVTESLDKYFSYSTPIHTDFGDLRNEINLSSNSALARAGFGQREHMSPLYTAMCSNAVITGELNVPFISKKTIDTVTWKDISELNTGKNTISTIPANLTHEVKLGMIDVACDLDLTVDRQGVKIYSKTGTAEIDKNSKDIHYIVVTLSDAANKPENTTTIVFQYLNSDKEFASGDRDHMQAILNMVYEKEENKS